MHANDLLDKVQINAPCQADWNSMIGNDRVRYCEHCNLTVHDLSQMTRKRARQLVARSKGRLCIRYERRSDGSLVTRAVPQKLFSIGRRVSRIAAGAFGATLGLSSAVAPASTARANTIYQGGVGVATRQHPAQQLYQGATIVGTITDQNGAVLEGATISLSYERAGLSLYTTSNHEGEYRFEGLEPGLYTLRSEAPGFAVSEHGAIYLGARALQRLDKRLEVGAIDEPVEVQSGGTIERHVTMGGAAIAIVEPSEPLVKAAQEDELLEVLAALTRENVNVRDKATGATALEHAVRNGNREMLQALISSGADVNSRNQFKETVLMMLGEEATSDMVWDLIHAGAKIDLKDREGDTALIEAAMVNNLGVLQTLLQAGAKVNAKNDEGQTALMLASSNDQLKNVKALIAAGADLNARDNEGKTALNYAAEEENEKIVKLLLSYGAVEGTPKVKDEG